MSTRAYRQAHKEEIRQYKKAYRVTHKEELRVRRKIYRATHKEQGKAYEQEHKDVRQVQTRRAGQEAKYEVFIHYSADPPTCANCGIDDVDVLCIDHINDDGAEHRKHVGSGKALHYWLKREGYPLGYQVLCRNCNWKKHLNYLKVKEDK